MAPHITEELWTLAGFEGYLHDTSWPEYDEAKTVEDSIEIPVQFNGKVRFTVKVPREASKEEVEKVVKAEDAFADQVGDKNVVKEIYVPGRIYNIVLK